MDGIVILVCLILAWLGARWLGRVIPKFQNGLDQRFPLDNLTTEILEYLRRRVATSRDILQHLDELGYNSEWEVNAELELLNSYQYIGYTGYSDERQLLPTGYEALEKNARLLKEIAINIWLAPQEHSSPEGWME